MPSAPMYPDKGDCPPPSKATTLNERTPRREFEDLVEAASAMMDVPFALVSMVEEGRRWFKAKVGLDAGEAAQGLAFCAHTVLDDRPFVVPDATLDARFAGHPLVRGAFGLRYYCGAPIVVDGLPLGTVCALGREPRQPTDRQIQGLTALARQAATHLEAKQAAALARRDEELLRGAAEATFDTFVVLGPLRDADGAVVDFRFDYVNAGAATFFGHGPDAILGRPFLESFPLENARRFVERFKRVLDTGEPFEAEYVSQMPAMKGRWARIKAARAGERIAVTGRDIHERREAEAALQTAKARLAATFDAVQVGIMLVAPSGEVLRANPAVEVILGFPMTSIHEQEGASAFDVHRTDGSRMPPYEWPIVQALAGRRARDVEMGLCWPDGRERWVRVNTVPLWHDGETAPYAAVCSFLDISLEVEQRGLLDSRVGETAETNILLEAQRYALEQANRRLEALATIDGLTGIRNHRAFQERLAAEVGRAERTGAPLSLVLLDVDRFKAFNDDFGHQAGDGVLRGVATALESVVRSTDLVARYGGEEFVVILPGAGDEEGFACAERLRKAIEESAWPDRPVTASFGVATLSSPMAGDGLIREADRALYASKRAGRNRTTHASAMESLGSA